MCIFFSLPIPHLISNTTNKNILYTYNVMIDIHNKKHVVSIFCTWYGQSKEILVFFFVVCELLLSSCIDIHEWFLFVSVAAAVECICLLYTLCKITTELNTIINNYRNLVLVTFLSQWKQVVSRSFLSRS